MSLHAELSPEAHQRLHAQRRNSTISSVVIALLTVVLVALALGVFLLPQLIEEPRIAVIYTPSAIDEPPVINNPLVPTHTDRRPSSPTQAMTKVIVGSTASPTAIPVPDVDITTPSLTFGDGDEFGSGWGENGNGDGFTNIPPAMKRRCSKADRLARLQETGGTPECEAAVVKALDWFKATQSADGSWGNRKPAMTGLAILAFLGHCETPLSADYGDSVLRGITYLVDLGMKNDGKLTTNPADRSWVYEHAIATYALGEAATFSKQGNFTVPDLFEVTRKAGQFIIDNQHAKTGGWAYAFDTSDGGHRDLSVTAWNIQALKACHHTGLEFKGLTRAANKAMDYVDAMKCSDGGFAYAKADEKPHADGYRTLTGAGVLSLQMWDKGSQSAARKGAKYIGENSKFDYNTGFCDLYGHYYEAQAMMNRGGSEWRKYNSMFRDQILGNQADNGSWKQPGGGKKVRAVAPLWLTDVHYRTALCTLMLEVYYRFLPGTGAGSR